MFLNFLSKLNKKALCFLYDAKYKNQGDHALLSAKRHNPKYTIIHLTDDKTKSIADIILSPEDIGLQSSDPNWSIIGRVAIIEHVLTKLGFYSCIFIDGDTYTYNPYTELQNELDKGCSLAVIPHIIEPLPEDGLYPQTRTMCFSGNYNTGCFGATIHGIDFIKWWVKQTSMYPQSIPEAGLASEQGWLRFAGDFDDKTKIFRHPGYNVAYWNVKERILDKRRDKWLIDGKPLVLMHFSGLKKELDPSHMSIFQNRHVLDKHDLAYSLFSDYHNLIWKS